VVQGDAAQIDVVVGLGTRGEGDPPVHHAELADQPGELLALAVGACHGSSS
jgi:hypothetical protein